MPELERHLAPLQSLVKKSAVFTWSVDQQSAFQSTKDAIRRHLVVNVPDYSEAAQLFKVITDASDWGFGAILIQGNRLLSCH